MARFSGTRRSLFRSPAIVTSSVTSGAVGSLLRQASGSGSMTYSGMTVTSGASLLVALVSLFVDKNSAISTVTWNGTGMTEAGSQSQDAAGNRVVSMWYLTSPASGNHDIVATLSGSTDEICIGAIEFNDATQVLNFAGDKTNGTPATSKSVNVTSATNHIVLGFGATLNNVNDHITMTGTEQTTLDASHGTPGNFRREICTYSGAASVTVQANSVDGSDEVWVCGADIAP